MLSLVDLRERRAEYLSGLELRQAGWTPALVRALLGEPDAEAPNPVYSRPEAPMRLYSRARVQAVRATPEAEAAFQVSARRRAAAKAASDRRAAALLAEVEAWTPQLPVEAVRIIDVALATVGRTGEGRELPAVALADVVWRYIMATTRDYPILLAAVERRAGSVAAAARLLERLAEAVLDAYGELLPELAERVPHPPVTLGTRGAWIPESGTWVLAARRAGAAPPSTAKG